MRSRRSTGCFELASASTTSANAFTAWLLAVFSAGSASVRCLVRILVLSGALSPNRELRHPVDHPDDRVPAGELGRCLFNGHAPIDLNHLCPGWPWFSP